MWVWTHPNCIIRQTIFRPLWGDGPSYFNTVGENLTYAVKLADLENPYYVPSYIASFRLKIPNFRYRGNRGSVWENLTYVVKFADLENLLLVQESWSYDRIFYLSWVVATFRLQIPNFRYHGNKGSVCENLTYVVKLADLESLLLVARIRVVSST